MNHLIQITKSDGTKELFEEEKLAASLRRAGTPEEVIDDVIERVGKEIKEGMKTDEIYSRAFAMLKKHSHPLAVKYSLRRALMELGPDGFPFEKFVALIFRKWGYEAVTDQVVMGGCVEYEMDVVAWKGDSLAMAEAKFHNAFVMKSDLKVALYVKARFDDISTIVYDYGGQERKLTESWLVTNTKFTDKAIHYSECKGVKLLGWNYPQKGNLHEIIEQNGLHPITCLSGLSFQNKKELISNNVLICADLVGNANALEKIGINGEKAAKIMDEARLIIEQAK